MEKLILTCFPLKQFVCFFTIEILRFNYLCPMFIRYFVIALILYFFLRFIFKFIIPVAKATKEMKSKMDEFKNRMEEQQNTAAGNTTAGTKPSSAPKDGDYIDFEEIN